MMKSPTVVEALLIRDVLANTLVPFTRILNFRSRLVTCFDTSLARPGQGLSIGHFLQPILLGCESDEVKST